MEIKKKGKCSHEGNCIIHYTVDALYLVFSTQLITKFVNLPSNLAQVVVILIWIRKFSGLNQGWDKVILSEI
jgi:hypothetical protein